MLYKKQPFSVSGTVASLFSVTLRGGRRRGGRRGTGTDGRSRLPLEARERRGNVGRLHGAAGSAAHPAPPRRPPLVVHRQGCRGPRLRRHDRVPGQRYPHGTWLSEAVVARLPCQPCHAADRQPEPELLQPLLLRGGACRVLQGSAHAARQSRCSSRTLAAAPAAAGWASAR